MSGNDVTEATFKGNISVEAVQKNKKELTPDYCFNLVEKDDTNMTASIGGQKNPVNGNYVNEGYYCYEGNNYDYEEITDVVIPSVIDGYTIVGIKGYSFFNLGLTSVDIPSTVKDIGYTSYNYGAFANNKLTNINIPASVSYIADGAFINNPLTNITVDPNNPVYDSRDNSNAIIKTSSNTLVQGSKNTIIPDTVNIIDWYAFSRFQLKSINIPDSVTTINEGAFSNNQLTSINLPNSVTEVGVGAFKYNNLNYVYIGSNSKLTNIRSGAFSSSNYTYTDSEGITYVDNPNLKVIYNNSGKAFDWNDIVNGSTGTSFVTGTTNTRTSGSTTYNSVEIKTGNP